jgi:hypothetical protein
MSIYITRNKEKFGPYSLEDVQTLVDDKIVSEMDFAWAEGEPEWVPLKKIAGLDFSREKAQVNLDEALKKARRRQEEDHTIGVKPMASMGRDMKNLKENISFTATDLTRFLGEMKGKSPKEMLGLVAQSTLFRGMITSTLFFAALIVVFTIIPFTLNKLNPPEKTQAQEEASPDEETENSNNEVSNTSAPNGQTTSTETPATDADGNPLPTGSSGNDVIDTLGIGETKVAAPNVNPLDDSSNDIFDELK